MQILLKGTTPDGMKIQIEDWSDEFPNICNKNSTIGFYPTCKTSIIKQDRPYMPPYPERGNTFRADLDFHNEQEAREAFLLMCGGARDYLSYMEYYKGNVISKENFLIAIA